METKTTELPQLPGRLIRLPAAPVTASPVPWLTSIHSTVPRGPYGDGSYRGNCGGYLIKDLLRYFQAQRVLDPMSGSGTCADVCRELNIDYRAFDLKAGADAADKANYRDIGRFDFVWLHPPYWRMIQYNDDRRCLSNATNLGQFLDELRRILRHCRRVLTPDGKIALLIGGYSDHGRYLPLAQLATYYAIKEKLWPTCTEIIRLQHNNSSSGKAYASSFIPGLHDTCLVLERR